MEVSAKEELVQLDPQGVPVKAEKDKFYLAKQLGLVQLDPLGIDVWLGGEGVELPLGGVAAVALEVVAAVAVGGLAKGRGVASLGSLSSTARSSSRTRSTKVRIAEEAVHIGEELFMAAKAVREDDAAEQFKGVGLGGFEIGAIAELTSLTRKVADLMVVGAYGDEFSGNLV